MNTLFVPFFLFSFLASIALAQDTFTINSLTDVTVCQPSLITWMNGHPPYFLTVQPENEPNAGPLVNLGEQNGTSFTWVVNIPAGDNGFLQLRDSTGVLAQSGVFSVQAGTTTSCLNSTSTGNTPASAGTGASTGATTGSTASSSGSASLTSASASASGTARATSTGSGAAPSRSSAAAASHYAPGRTLAMTGAAALAFALVL